MKAAIRRALWMALLSAGLIVLAANSAEARHVGGTCQLHDEANPCDAATVPEDRPNTVGQAKPIPVAPKKVDEPGVMDKIGDFFGAVGKGIGDGANAAGSAVKATFVGAGAFVVGLVRPLARVLAALQPSWMGTTLYSSTVAVGSGAVLAGAQFGAWSAWKRLFPLGLPFYGLFSRIDKDELLENERRARIFELIKANPGIHLSEIARELEFAWGTTLHHLRKLRADRLILFKSLGHHKSFFVNGSGLSETQMEAMSLIKNGTVATLARYLEQHPRVSLKELSEALDISPPLAAFHIRKLEKAGLVQKVRDGKSVRLTTTQNLPAGFFGSIAEHTPTVPTPVDAAS